MTSSLKLFLILYYIKQIDSKLPCVCSVIDHRGRQNVVRTSVTHLAAPRVPLFCSYHILTSFVIYYWTDARQLGIYLLIITLHSMNHLIGQTFCSKNTSEFSQHLVPLTRFETRKNELYRFDKWYILGWPEIAHKT